jgi:hypothetical protein
MLQPANDVAIRIEDTEPRHIGDRQAFLPAGLPQQGGGLEQRRRVRILIVENWRRWHAGS